MPLILVMVLTGFEKNLSSVSLQAMGMPPSAANMQALATWLATLLAMQPTAMQQLLQPHQPQQATPPTQVVEHAQPSDMPAHGGMTSTHVPAPAAAAAAAEVPLTAACSAGQPSLSAATRTAGMGAAPAPCVAPSVSSRHFADVASVLVPLQLSAPPASFLRLPNTVRPPLEPV